MPYNDGTMTADEHADLARTLLTPVGYEGDHLDVFQSRVVDALRAIGHTQLAILEEIQARRAEGRGW